MSTSKFRKHVKRRKPLNQRMGLEKLSLDDLIRYLEKYGDVRGAVWSAICKKERDRTKVAARAKEIGVDITNWL